MSCLALRISQYVRLHLPKPGFFQCFPTAPPSQWYGNGEVGVEENPQAIVYRIVGITISNSQGLLLGFSFRSTPQHLCLMWVYIV